MSLMDGAWLCLGICLGLVIALVTDFLSDDDSEEL